MFFISYIYITDKIQNKIEVFCLVHLIIQRRYNLKLSITNIYIIFFYKSQKRILSNKTKTYKKYKDSIIKA